MKSIGSARFLSSVLPAAVLAACATLKLPEYTPTSTMNQAYISEKEGLQIAFTPMSDRSEVKKHFGADLIEVGVCRFIYQPAIMVQDPPILLINRISP